MDTKLVGRQQKEVDIGQTTADKTIDCRPNKPMFP